MSELLATVDARTRLAGTNRLEMLLFSLGEDCQTGRREIFGINVFKVREVTRRPPITRSPDLPPGVEGMVSLRSHLTPVINLGHFARVATSDPLELMITTEYNGRVQGFLVHSVETILRLDWSQMKVPPAMISAEKNGAVTAVAELKDGRLVMMLDVERVLAETTPHNDDYDFQQLVPVTQANITVFFADDSTVARKQIERTLDALNLRHIAAVNGADAWRALCRIADQAAERKLPASNEVQLIITDVEMPEMDGFMLTKKIRSDPRFRGIPILMHSSLSGESNQLLGLANGVDEYIPKFEARRFAEIVSRHLKLE